MIKCPCCNYLTIDNNDDPICDICEVCFWQYDEIAQKYPDKVIGPNKISLNEAKNNYQRYHACEYRFISMVREPYIEEF